ncbi:peptidoglycan recognition protein [Enterococcus sp. BWM-S5]|uniref:Peptidoglycan recognition protein n=1 Tax=Enterococcus larvae TaxID=2794352 RepID=A0ABS4CE24_9ENTE|nr:N-acetylmuramoyl-L-alanine amidase [Enterococcus larvae]MBP1044834.1 peptidoglycan recognition protein [Enterococcus larvae]
MSICGGIAGSRGRNPSGVVIHNDAGSINATAAFYRNWLPNHNLVNGFAHEYVCSDGIVHAEDYEFMAWHTANSIGNANYIGIEVCQSMGNEITVIANEQASFKLAAEILKRYGLVANVATVKLHREFVATSCPHRSWELHGQAIEAVRSYYIQEINKYMNATNVTPEAPDNTNTEENKQEEFDMVCLFVITPGGQALHYFDGKNITTLQHPDEGNILKAIYKENYGKDMPVIYRDGAWFQRLKDVAQRKVL